MTPQLVPGDHVMVKEQTLGKLTDRARGPFEVIRVNRGGTVHVKSSDNKKVLRLPPDLVFRYRKTKDEDNFKTEEANKELQDEDDQILETEEEQLTKKRRSNLRDLKVPDYSRFY